MKDGSTSISVTGAKVSHDKCLHLRFKRVIDGKQQNYVLTQLYSSTKESQSDFAFFINRQRILGENL